MLGGSEQSFILPSIPTDPSPEGVDDHISNPSTSSDNQDPDASVLRGSTSDLQLEVSGGTPDSPPISSATTMAFSAPAEGGVSPAVPHRDGEARVHGQDSSAHRAYLNQQAAADDKRQTAGYRRDVPLGR
jgi:hypothetical protein